MSFNPSPKKTLALLPLLLLTILAATDQDLQPIGYYENKIFPAFENSPSPFYFISQIVSGPVDATKFQNPHKQLEISNSFELNTNLKKEELIYNDLSVAFTRTPQTAENGGLLFEAHRCDTSLGLTKRVSFCESNNSTMLEYDPLKLHQRVYSLDSDYIMNFYGEEVHMTLIYNIRMGRLFKLDFEPVKEKYLFDQLIYNDFGYNFKIIADKSSSSPNPQNPNPKPVYALYWEKFDIRRGQNLESGFVKNEAVKSLCVERIQASTSGRLDVFILSSCKGGIPGVYELLHLELNFQNPEESISLSNIEISSKKPKSTKFVGLCSTNHNILLADEAGLTFYRVDPQKQTNIEYVPSSSEIKKLYCKNASEQIVIEEKNNIFYSLNLMSPSKRYSSSIRFSFIREPGEDDSIAVFGTRIRSGSKVASLNGPYIFMKGIKKMNIERHNWIFTNWIKPGSESQLSIPIAVESFKPVTGFKPFEQKKGTLVVNPEDEKINLEPHLDYEGGAFLGAKLVGLPAGEDHVKLRSRVENTDKISIAGDRKLIDMDTFKHWTMLLQTEEKESSKIGFYENLECGFKLKAEVVIKGDCNSVGIVNEPGFEMYGAVTCNVDGADKLILVSPQKETAGVVEERTEGLYSQNEPENKKSDFKVNFNKKTKKRIFSFKKTSSTSSELTPLTLRTFTLSTRYTSLEITHIGNNEFAVFVHQKKAQLLKVLHLKTDNSVVLVDTVEQSKPFYIKNSY